MSDTRFCPHLRRVLLDKHGCMAECAIQDNNALCQLVVRARRHGSILESYQQCVTYVLDLAWPEHHEANI